MESKQSHDGLNMFNCLSIRVLNEIDHFGPPKLPNASRAPRARIHQFSIHFLNELDNPNAQSAHVRRGVFFVLEVEFSLENCMFSEGNLISTYFSRKNSPSKVFSGPPWSAKDEIKLGMIFVASAENPRSKRCIFILNTGLTIWNFVIILFGLSCWPWVFVVSIG